MDPEKWSEIKQIFHEAADMPFDLRGEFLAAACNGDNEILSEVEKLLSSDVEAEPFSDVFSMLDAGKPLIDKHIGNYELISELGHGGMGTVYLAARKDFEKQVALKIVKREFSSTGMVRRFQNERRILAALEHSNIARLLDGGTTENGLPYFVMEYINGTDLLSYCNNKDLSIVERLKIFRKVCAAVSYAHGKLVVHRDLKPTNILVTAEDEPKLLDFGISKLLDEEAFEHTGTATALGMMTPNYASPEQFRGETVSTSTDVYSLGVILYELLTGRLPYKIKNKRIDEAARIINEVEAARPSSVFNKSQNKITYPPAKPKSSDDLRLARTLQGDLDNIILKSLSKETARRYNSVEQFSEDLRRFLEGKPVMARPATFGYRASKFIGRNRLAVASASLASTAVISGITATVWQSLRANRQKKLAEKRFDEVRQLARNVLFKYHDAIADLPGSTAARELLIRDASHYLDNLSRETYGEFELEEELASAYLKIGDVQGRTFQANLGNSRSALENYRKSFHIFQRLTAQRPSDSEILRSLFFVTENYTLLCARLADWKTAQELAAQCANAGRRLVNLDPENVESKILFVRSYLAMGEAAEFANGFSKQIEIYREGLKHAENLLAQNPRHPGVLRVYVTMAQRTGTQLEYLCDALREQGEGETEILPKLRESVKLHLESLHLVREMLKAVPNNSVTMRSEAACTNNVGSAFARLGYGEESLKYTRAALEKFYKLAATDENNKEAQRDIADSLQYIGMGYAALRDFPSAINSYSDALNLLEPLISNDNVNYEFLEQTHHIYNEIGNLHLQSGDFPKAVDYYEAGFRLIEGQGFESKNYQLQALLAVSLEKLGDCFAWLISNLTDSLEKPFFAAQATAFYSQSLSKLLELKNAGQLSHTSFYKIPLIPQKLLALEKEFAEKN